MRNRIGVLAGIALLFVSAQDVARGLAGPDRFSTQEAASRIPQSLQTEHEAIHHALVQATRTPGRVGAAAKELASLLEPHFKRENEIALPPLGLLASLAAGERPAGLEAALAMTDAAQGAASHARRTQADSRRDGEAPRRCRDAKAPVQEQFAEDLARHAQTEEEVLYPAAILVGDVIRARMKK